MSTGMIKLIAVAAMIADHTGIALYWNGLISPEVYHVMRCAGRIGFPLFAFMLANGFDRTSDRVRYLSRLSLFALVSQVPFVLCLFGKNYRTFDTVVTSAAFTADVRLLIAGAVLTGTAWFFLVRRDSSAVWSALAVLAGGLEIVVNNVWLLTDTLNIFYTLAMSLAVFAVLDRFSKRENISHTLILAAVLLIDILLLGKNTDYGFSGILLIFGLWAVRESRVGQAAWIILWAWFEYSQGTGGLSHYTVSAAAAVIPVLMYNGTYGRLPKRFFYWVYPSHLAIIGTLNLILK